MLDQILDFLSDLPISLIIFAIALLFGFFGRDDKRQPPETAPREADMAPPPEPSTYASDDRRTADQFGGMRDEFGGQSPFEFGTSESFGREGPFESGADDEMFQDRTQWGQTKFGFNNNEWGSTFDDGGDHWGDREKPDSEPRIEIG